MPDANAPIGLVPNLCALHRAVGAPNPAEVEMRSQLLAMPLPKNTVDDLINGRRARPTWRTVERFVTVCSKIGGKRGVRLRPEWGDMQWWRRLHEAEPTAPSRPESRTDAYWDARARGVESAHVPGTYFTGRRRALTELAEWLIAEPRPGDNVRVVSGGPGSGKSGVLARLVTRSDPLFRQQHPAAADDPLYALPAGVIDVAAYARGLDSTEIVQVLAAGFGSAVTDFAALVDSLAARGTPMTFVIDGLDESTDPKRTATVLRRLGCDTADFGVRLLIGTRPGHQRALQRALGAGADRTAIDLDAAYLDRADLAEYVRRRLMFEGLPAEQVPVRDTPYRGRDQLAARVAAQVADRAYPSFLVAALTAVGLVRSGTVVDVAQDGWDKFPATVADAMRDCLERFPAPDADRVEDLLRPLAYTHGTGLPPGELWSLLACRLGRPGRTYRVEDIVWLLDTAADYLLEATADDTIGATYRLYHRALIDHLREQDRARGVPAEQWIYRQLLDSVPRTPAGDADWNRTEPYLRKHLVDHAAATGQLGDLVDDPGFLVAADPATLTSSLRRSPQNNHPGARTYLTTAHLLADPDDRAFQLQLHAARLHEAVAERWFAALTVDIVPRLAWTRESRYTPHYTVGRHTKLVRAVAVGALEGRPVVVSGGDDATVRVWDLATGASVGNPLIGHTDSVRAVALGVLDGRPVAVSGGPDRTVRVWDLGDGAPVGDPSIGRTCLYAESAVRAVAAGELDGRSVVITGGDDATVRVWNPITGTPVGAPFTGHTTYVAAVALGALEGRPVVISGSGDATVRVWDFATGNQLGPPLTGHTAPVRAVALGALEGRPVVISGGEDATVRVWDLSGGTPVGRPFGRAREDHPFVRIGKISAVAFCEVNGRPVVVSGDGDQMVRVWDLATGAPMGDPLTGHVGTYAWDADMAVAVGSVDGRPVVVSGGDDATVRVWDLASVTGDGDPLTSGPCASDSGGVRAVALGELAGRPVVVSGGRDHTVRVWDLANGSPIGDPFTGHTDEIRAVAVGALDGRSVVVSGGQDCTVRVWDLVTGHPIDGPLSGHTGSVEAVALGTIGGRTVVVSGSLDCTVRVWDTAGGSPVGDPMTGHAGPVEALSVGAFGGRTMVVSGSLDRTVRVCDLATGAPICDPFTGHTGPVEAVALGTIDGRPVVVSGGRDHTVRVWDLATGAAVGHPLVGHTDEVRAVAVGAVDRLPVVVSASRDRTVRVWELTTGRKPRVIRLSVSISSVTRPENGLVVAGHRAGLTAVCI